MALIFNLAAMCIYLFINSFLLIINQKFRLLLFIYVNIIIFLRIKFVGLSIINELHHQNNANRFNNFKLPGVTLCLKQRKSKVKSNLSVTFYRSELLSSSFEHSKAEILTISTVKTRAQKLNSMESYRRFIFDLAFA